jgi:tetratricopeptide (TPR) repeat protein
MERQAWQECIEKFKAIIDLDPDYKDVQALLEECQRALEQEKKHHTVAQRYVEGISFFESQRWPEALAAFQEVQRLSPGYKRVEAYINDAERLSQPTLWQRSSQTITKMVAPESWGRWGLIGVGLIAIILTFGLLSNGSPATGNDDPKEQLKRVYDQAQAALAQNDTEQAISLLEQILNQDPDYADAAELRRDLIAALTPTPTVTPLPAINASVENPLVAQLAEAEDNLELGLWSEVIEILESMREVETEFEQARVASLFCDAYIGRGLDNLRAISTDNDQEKWITMALADFEAGVEECPRRIDLQEQAERAAAYLEALNTSPREYELLIRTLNPLVAADPNYAQGKAKDLLYNAYLNRGKARNEAGEIVGALGDYEAALALNVDDPAEVQTRRAELILSFQQPGEALAQTSETPEPSPTPVTNDNQNDPPPTSTPETSQVLLEKPMLLGPADDLKFAGQFDEVILKWEPIEQLAADEYYDLTIMHIFAEQPTYWGVATEETQVRLVPTNIGVGKAGNDRFYWWVTVRKRDSAPPGEALDLARSPESEVRTFVWTP